MLHIYIHTILSEKMRALQSLYNSQLDEREYLTPESYTTGV